MLLRVENLSAVSGLSLSNMFILNDMIIGVADDIDKPWAIYSIDMATFAFKEISVVFQGDFIRECIQCPLAVYDDVVYAWSPEEAKMIAGHFENGCITWKIINTKRMPQMQPLQYCGADNQVSSTFTTMFANFDQYYLCILDLSTMEWAEPIRICESVYAGADEFFYVQPTSSAVHVMISDDSDSFKRHHVMDRATNKWTLVDMVSAETNFEIYDHLNDFICRDQLYSFGRDKRYGDEGNALFRFDTTHNIWIKMYQFPYALSEYGYGLSEGSRIFLFDSDRVTLNKLYVFDLEPTLFDRARAVVLRSETYKAIGEACLPRNIAYVAFQQTDKEATLSELAKQCHRFFIAHTFDRITLNRDTSGDHLVPVRTRLDIVKESLMNSQLVQKLKELTIDSRVIAQCALYWFLLLGLLYSFTNVITIIF